MLPKGNVSKRHAKILYREGRFVITDANSTNGTYVNRRRISQATIVRGGDKIYLGDFILSIDAQYDSAQYDSGLSSRPDAPSAPTTYPDNSPVSPPAPSQRFSTNLPERLSVSPLELNSSVPPARTTEMAPSGEVSSSSQRMSDLVVAHRELVAELVDQYIKKHGEPPLQPSSTTQALIESEVSEAADALLVDGKVPVGSSLEVLSSQALDELLDLGPLRALLDDPAVSSTAAARFDELVGVRDGRQQTFLPGFSCKGSLARAIARLADSAHCKLPRSGVVEFELAQGARFVAIVGEVTDSGPLFTLNKPRVITSSLDDLVRRGAISRTMANFLSQSVSARLNILIIGPKDEGSRVVLSALANASRERVIAATDFDDIVGENENAVRLRLDKHQGKVRQLFALTTSIPKARLAITLNSPEVMLATLEAVGGGTNGVIATAPGSNMNRALQRLPVDIASARRGVSLESANAWLLSAFDLVVEVARLRDGRVRVLNISELVSDKQGKIEASNIFRFTVSRVAAGGAVEGAFLPSATVPRVAAQIRATGIRLETGTFSRPASSQEPEE